MHGTNVKITKRTFCWFVIYSYIKLHGADNIKSVNNAWNCDFEFYSIRFRSLSICCKYSDIPAVIDTVRSISNLMDFWDIQDRCVWSIVGRQSVDWIDSVVFFKKQKYLFHWAYISVICFQECCPIILHILERRGACCRCL